MRHVRREWFWIAPLLLVIATVSLFLFYEATPYFPDPDSFYHAGIAQRMASEGLVQDFPWLPFTTLADNFADQHFGYHLFLMPFVTAFDPLIGVKVATVVLAAGFLLVFYFFLRSFHVRYPFLFSLALLVVNPFTFRLGLAKATALALIIFFLGLWALFHFRWKWLMLFAFLYTFIHGGFLLLAFSATFFVAMSMILNTARGEQHHRALGKIFAGVRRALRFRKRPYFHTKIALAVLLGFGLGIVLNPYFPQNTFFLYEQVVEIGFLNAQDVIAVGGEWYPYAFSELIPNAIIAVIAFVIAFPAFLLTLKRQSKQSWTLLLLTAFLFLFTLKSRRYVEYFVPLTVAFSAFAVTAALGKQKLREALRILPPWGSASLASRILVVSALTVISILLPTVLIRDIITEREDFQRGFHITTSKRSMEALKLISSPGDIVVHSDWDEFPMLFYYNSENFYIAGLDPTFLYRKDPERHRNWVDITTGAFSGDPTEVIRNDLQASWVFVAKDHTGMDRLIGTQTEFALVYEDEEAKIYDARP